MNTIPTKPTCAKCGYDLAGLRVEDVCPECGVAVFVSSRDYLHEEVDKTCRWAWWSLGLALSPLVAAAIMFLWPLAWILPLAAFVFGASAIFHSRELGMTLNEAEHISSDGRRLRRATLLATFVMVILLVELIVAIVMWEQIFG